MAICYPDYTRCLVNVASSLERAFGLTPAHNTLPECDGRLKKYDKVVLLLLDGMGTDIMRRHLAPDGFFRSHLDTEITTVFPPTTVAATTSVQSGLTPWEHGWLGWDCYFKEVDQNVTVFRNTISNSDTPAAEVPLAETYRPYRSIVQRLQEQGILACSMAPFGENQVDSLPEMGERLLELTAKPGKAFFYCYWAEPDHTLHTAGVDAPEVGELLRSMEAQVEEFCGKLRDTLVIVVADHGHRNIKGLCVEDYPDIMECLKRLPSVESRAVSWFIKPEKKADFEAAFHRHFEGEFLLLSREEVAKTGLLGVGACHPGTEDSLGDYLMPSIGDLCLCNTQESAHRFVSGHAGLTDVEMHIPLIFIET